MNLTQFLYQRRMTGRDPHEKHRAATTLELFFDLIFVVAIAAAASGLHHAISEHHITMGILNYLFAFFCIWWAWMNFTWFASAFDTDDVSFRLMAFVQMFGSLVIAAGISGIFQEEPQIFGVVFGFCIMRVALAGQWLRAAVQAPKYRKTALRYAFGVIFMQCWWIVFAVMTPNTAAAYIMAALCMAGELAVPIWAEKAGRTPWHSHHMAERYGLLVIIVLGEGILGTVNTVNNAFRDYGFGLSGMISLGLGSLGLTFALWWAYFNLPEEKVHSVDASIKKVFPTAYGHFFLFASLAAVGTGLELLADVLVSQKSHAEQAHSVSPLLAMATLSIAVFLSMFSMSFIGQLVRPEGSASRKLLFVGLPLCFLPVVAVYAGLGLNWAVWLSVLGPASMITIATHHNKRDAQHQHQHHA